MLVSRIASGLDRKRFTSIIGLFALGWLKDRCETLGLPTFVVPMEGQWDFRWIVQCCGMVRQQNVSLIHAHEFRANVFGALVAKLCGIPLVATVHGKNYYPDHAKRRMAYRWASRAAHMVAVSYDLRRFIGGHVGRGSGYCFEGGWQPRDCCEWGNRLFGSSTKARGIGLTYH